MDYEEFYDRVLNILYNNEYPEYIEMDLYNLVCEYEKEEDYKKIFDKYLKMGVIKNEQT